MARLPPGGQWLIQLIGDEVILFERGTEAEIVRFTAADAEQAQRAQKVIHESPRLDGEQKAFAHFWSGYFYRCARDHVNDASAT